MSLVRFRFWAFVIHINMDNRIKDGILAQLVEHLTFNQVVRGSNPRCLIRTGGNAEYSAFPPVFMHSPMQRDYAAMRTHGREFFGGRQRDCLSRFSVHFFPRATSQVDVLARIFDDCRERQMSRMGCLPSAGGF